MRIFGIIGQPLGHSFSQGYFTEKFAALGLAGECRYDNFELKSLDELPRMLTEHPHLVGFNVTIPYKKEIMFYMNTVSGEARAIGAVNCVLVSDGWLHGYNTDAYGFRMGLEKLLGAALGEAKAARPRALVLGTGGASCAVRYVLEREGIEYRMVSRADGEGLLSYGELTPAVIEGHRLIINTTPLGTFPEVDGKPDLPYEAIGEGHFLYDLVYNPAETAFLAEGVRRGAATLNGLAMLHAQAEKSWEIWTDNTLLT